MRRTNTCRRSPAKSEAAIALVVFVAACSDAEAPAPAGACGRFREGPALVDHREASAAFLQPDGRVLLVGGHFDNASGEPVDSSELVDVEAGTSSFAGSFSVPHTTSGLGPTVALDDGSVLSGSPFVFPHETAIAGEIWNPATQEWSVTGQQNVPTGGGVTLPDGRVLAAGGIDWNVDAPLARAEIWDPASGAWTMSAAMSTARTGHQLLLVGARALAIGGFAEYPDADGVGTSELFDPETETWFGVAPMTERRAAPAVVLADGRVFTAGGTAVSGGEKPVLASAEIYDPAPNAWSPAAPMHVARSLHTLTLLDDGRILAAGGADETWASTTSAEVYDPSTDSWSVVEPMEKKRRVHAATLLPSGEVLIAGGYPSGLYSTEVFSLCQ